MPNFLFFIFYCKNVDAAIEEDHPKQALPLPNYFFGPLNFLWPQTRVKTEQNNGDGNIKKANLIKRKCNEKCHWDRTGEKGLHCPVRAAWQFSRFFTTQPNWTELNCRKKCNGDDDEKQNSPWRDFMHIYHNFTRSQDPEDDNGMGSASVSVAHIKNNRLADGGFLGQLWRGVEIAFCLLRAMTFMTVS